MDTSTKVPGYSLGARSREGPKKKDRVISLDACGLCLPQNLRDVRPRPCRDIQTTIKRTPRKYAALRSNSGRFGTSYKASDTTLLPFYDVGRYTSLQTKVKESPRKMSSLRSKVPRFAVPKPRNTGASESVYNTDVMQFASMGTHVATSPRSYKIVRSNQPRFRRQSINSSSLGPGSYTNAQEVSTSTGRYMSTVGSILLSPRNYSSFKSKTPRFKGGAFGTTKRAAGGGRMWPPMKPRGRWN